jgi:hypothetical protein
MYQSGIYRYREHQNIKRREPTMRVALLLITLTGLLTLACASEGNFAWAEALDKIDGKGEGEREFTITVGEDCDVINTLDCYELENEALPEIIE